DITDIRGAISEIRADLSGLTNRIGEVEDRVSSLEDDRCDWESHLQQLERNQEQLQDLENCSHRNNIHLLGLPKGEERNSGPKFLKCLLITCFNLPEGDTMEIEQAPRALGPRPGPDQRPRPIIARFLRFQDRERVLWLVREAGEVHWRGECLMFFPGLSKELVENRRRFTPVRRKYMALNLRDVMLFPATLKITVKG
uniref:L1 transposable element RRM domain-containing protein n=1 Tax=Latimeria chalumnae TaxID=7897 RepID=H3B1D0_LATCH